MTTPKKTTTRKNKTKAKPECVQNGFALVLSPRILATQEGKNPLVVAVDCSGSMADYVNGAARYEHARNALR